MSQKPRISDDPMFLLLKDRQIEAFNRRKAAGERPQLSNCDYSGMDLRGLDADGLDFSDSYFHQTDLRDVDLRNTILVGASIHGALLAGCYFPADLSPREIELSLEHGTRLRYGTT